MTVDRIGPVALFAVAVAVGAMHLPVALWRVRAEIRQLEASQPLARELRGASYVGVDTRVFVAARRLLPKDATYAVLTGPDAPAPTPATLDAVRPFAAFWLLPRHQTADPRRAEWVVSYGRPLAHSNRDYERIHDVAPAIWIAEVRR